MSDIKPMPDEGKHLPPHKPHDVPPHILKELFRMSEKIGRLEGMIEVLLQQKQCSCSHDK